MKRSGTYADDDHKLNHVRTNLDSVSTVQSDSPRFTQTRTFIENFNSGAEQIVDNSLATGHQVANIDGTTVSASLIQVQLQNHPNGNVTNTYVGTSGWLEGLPIRVDDYANGNGLELVRYNWTRWSQDDTNATYVLNPRVTETKVSDGSNTKRTKIDYYEPTTGSFPYGLPETIQVFDGQVSHR